MGDAEVLDRRADALEGDRRGLQGLAGQEDQELLATVAIDRVPAANRSGQRLADRAQGDVTGRMT